MSTSPFDSVHNHHESLVFAAVETRAKQYPMIAASPDLMADVACVALNRIGPRYIRHAVDFAFYLTEKERAESDRAVDEAVAYAFEFVQARRAMRARL